MRKEYYVYVMANDRPTIYVGITSNLVKRVYEHKNGLVDGFTKKYKLHKLLYFEQTTDVKSAIAREKQLKNWRRDWKINLIKSVNPQLDDLYSQVCSYDSETSSE